jgi:hypothetical protein
MSAAIAAVVGSVAVGAFAANRASSAAKKASNAQSRSADAGIAEQQRQFDEIQKLLAPYVKGGTDATELQRAFLGLAGPGAEQAAIEGVRAGPQFQAAAREGENAILQNAAATGGLRGGNVQASLAKFRPNLLNQVIAQRFAGLDALAGRGQASAAGQAAAGQNSANAIAGLLQDQGAAQAGAALARGNAQAGFAGTLAQAGATLGGYFLNRPRNPGGIVGTSPVPGATPPFVGPQ